MERVTKREQLTIGCRIWKLEEGLLKEYIYLMDNIKYYGDLKDKYIIFLNNFTKKPERLYINTILFSGQFYIGEFDEIFLLNKCKEYYLRGIKRIERRITEIEQNN